MALIKYYNLVSRSWNTVSDLELDLQKRLLSEKQLQKELSVSADRAVEARSNGDAETLNLMVYDSGEFDILYKSTNQISARKTSLFRADIPEKVGVELVVKATLEDLLQLQEYLQSSKFDLVEARAVSQATLAFATLPANGAHTENYGKIINDTITEQYPTLKAKLTTQKNVLWDDKTGSTMMGVISGPVQDILYIRTVLIHSATTCGAPIKRNSISFS